METLIRTQKITESRDLKPGDVISQEYLDNFRGEETWAVRSIRIDRRLSAYLVYRTGGLDYLVPVIVLHGWDVRRGQGVRITCMPHRVWTTDRAEGA